MITKLQYKIDIIEEKVEAELAADFTFFFFHQFSWSVNPLMVHEIVSWSVKLPSVNQIFIFICVFGFTLHCSHLAAGSMGGGGCENFDNNLPPLATVFPNYILKSWHN